MRNKEYPVTDKIASETAEKIKRGLEASESADKAAGCDCGGVC